MLDDNLNNTVLTVVLFVPDDGFCCLGEQSGCLDNLAHQLLYSVN